VINDYHADRMIQFYKQQADARIVQASLEPEGPSRSYALGSGHTLKMIVSELEAARAESANGITSCTAHSPHFYDGADQ
jgi:hypothetical protein